jgi:hypothetical protein
LLPWLWQGGTCKIPVHKGVVMIFKLVSPEKSNQLIDWCEANNQDWDIWNAAETFVNPNATVEFGMSKESWEIYNAVHY